MRVLAVLSLNLLLPLAALAQAPAPAVAAQAAPVATGTAEHWALPMWRAADGKLLVLTGADTRGVVRSPTSVPFKGALAPGALFQSAGVRWTLAGHGYTRVGISRIDVGARAACITGDALCLRQRSGWTGGQIGGGYDFAGFSVDVGASWLDHADNRHALPAVMPRAAVGTGVGLLGVPGQWVDSLGSVNASGSLRLGDGAQLDLGASVGRMQMLPGNESGLDAIDQRALSFGVGAGPISGTVVGRVMQPIAGVGVTLPGAEQRWSALDLGISVRFPWEGELSIGARNLWSSSHAALPATPTEPSQGRVPYIQYHQEL
ncbi:MAG TPA: hypothetical protein VFN09_05845 [Rhodanobacteraceae bacterium]|nr:hypothetical protein [Rhodanobacteraceae bacterium]